MLYGIKQFKKSCYFFVFCTFFVLLIKLIWYSFNSVEHLNLKPHDGLGFNLQHSIRERNEKIINSLNHQVEDLKHLLEIKTNQLEKAIKINSESENGGNVEIPDNLLNVFQDGDSILHFVNEKIEKSEALNGALLKNENEVNHFTFFDRNVASVASRWQHCRFGRSGNRSGNIVVSRSRGSSYPRYTNWSGRIQKNCEGRIFHQITIESSDPSQYSVFQNKAYAVEAVQKNYGYETGRFTSSAIKFKCHDIFQLRSELNNKPREVWSHRRELRRELFEVIANGVLSLNGDPERRKVSPTYRFTERDFLHGLYRTERGIGTHYELVYKPRSSTNIINDNQLFRVTMFRPFAPLKKIDTSALTQTETIHFIIPLSGRADTFRVFIDYFKQDALPYKNVHLTVVYYGNEGLREVEEILHSLKINTGFKNYKLVTVNDEFSRGKALQRGADSLDPSNNPLMFFCDVDLAFTPDFLNQCRAYTSPGKLVFFPIVFSLFNPSIVYEKLPIPRLRDRQHFKKNTGFWRDFGFGMSCQYLNDFRQIGGFDLGIKGWGTEDLRLYRKYTKSSFSIVRTPVNSLFHHWHPKFCGKNWSTEQYESCLKSRIRNEGSVLQLGAKYYELKEKLEPPPAG